MEDKIEIFNNEILRYFEDGGDYYIRYRYTLDENSVVFDVGGYIGDFAKSVIENFGCKVFVFEPTSEYYSLCRDKFRNVKNVRIFNYGIGDKNGTSEIYMNGDATSSNIKSDKVEEIKISTLRSSIDSLGITNIDLLKINIEGDEYGLLEKAIEDDVLKLVKNIQVQYHLIEENCIERRENINKKLEETHELEWRYDWVWESWKIKK